MTEREIRHLHRTRGFVETRLKQFETHVSNLESFMSSEELDPLDQAALIQLQDRIDAILNITSEYDSINNELIAIVEDDLVEQHYDDRNTFETTYFAILARAKAILEQHQSVDNQSIQSQSSVNSRARSTRSSPNALCNVKLPTLNLIKFSGQYSEWLAFYDTFSSLIHNNDSLTPIQKFHYLRSSLEGEALRVIQNLEISAQNYTEAFAILEKRYKNKRLMIHNHIKGILDFQKINKESFSSLRTLVNETQNHLRALKVLGEPVDSWDSILIHILADKFDYSTRKEWEAITAKESSSPTMNQLVQFLEQRCHFLEKINKQTKTLEPSQNSGTVQGKSCKTSKVTQHLSYLSTERAVCMLCKEKHALYACTSFLNLPVQTRISEVKRLRLCLNCLRPNHISINCTSSNCRKCSKKHNTMLHIDNSTPKTETIKNEAEANIENDETNTSSSNHTLTVKGRFRLLPTAVVTILDHTGKPHECNALLDSGSESNFMTSELLHRLRLKSNICNDDIRGINETRSKSVQSVNATIKSRVSQFEATLSYLVLPKITQTVPSMQLDFDVCNIPKNIRLADPLFHQPKEIDLLLGVDVFQRLLCSDSLELNHPYLFNTHFGYVFSGNVSQINSKSSSVSCHLTILESRQISQQIAKFWEVEDFPSPKQYTKEEQSCELQFKETTKRNKHGQFIVSLPLKGSLNSLGDSKEHAKSRFLSLEKRLQSNLTMRQMYIDFMSEYERLGHMSKDNESREPPHTYYMPHHGVLKPSSTTTKLRVVFNGSAPSSSGVSINDLQMVGPTIQDDLLSIIIRFRKHNIAISSDCRKMYRSVYIEESQRPLQRIFWRSSPDLPLDSYTLNTVTYGTASASFLAIRCLFELSYLAEKTHPEIAEIIRRDMYVDDLLTGSSSISNAREICSSISEILTSGGFHLGKWSSNEPQALDSIDPSDISSHLTEFSSDDVIKALGISWNNRTDEFVFNITLLNNSEPITKRTVLSVISRIFDPLGISSPCIVRAKIFMQRLWSERLSWDEPLPEHLKSQWLKYIQQFPVLQTLSIPRQVTCKSPKHVEIHGFSDASEVAYGCCIYIRSVDESDCVTVRLLCSKSKVAPLKSLTIPRLELCGALILARLVKKVVESLKVEPIQCTYWCDSSIALSWIKSDPATLKQFVSNRVSEISLLASNTNDWRYVPSADNPADLVSRGVNPNSLKHNSLWWAGPTWLQKSEDHWPQMPFNHSEEIPERKIVSHSYASMSILSFPFENYSSLTRLERVIAWCFRFKTNSLLSKNKRTTGPLTCKEIHEAHLCLVRVSQSQSFSQELTHLNNNNSIASNSKIISLNPFISNGLLRVGGRLDNSKFSYSKKHPLILSSKHPFTKLLFQREHVRLLHAGPNLLLSSIRDQHWPVAGRNLAKGVVHACIKCFRSKPKLLNQIMGNLPTSRVVPAPTFSVTGLDYAGPVLIKDRKGKGCKTSKAYICVFVCFATKALHIELVTDLTKEGFIMALRRFASRRGLPAHIYSDNGTNFVSAKQELQELGKFLVENHVDLSSHLANENCNWHFIPAYSPHMGGLWEASVKSVKHHLRRVMSNSVFTYEELYTLLCQIECVLNSRPLSPISTTPDDLSPLTPSHFLIGRPLISVPDPDVTHISQSRLSRHQHIQQILQRFWKRWSQEYISQLQQRTKWRRLHENLRVGDMVLIKDDHLPPLRWALGRVSELHPGTDGLTRVASIRTSKGTIKRNIAKLCVLPSIEETDSV